MVIPEVCLASFPEQHSNQINKALCVNCRVFQWLTIISFCLFCKFSQVDILVSFSHDWCVGICVKKGDETCTPTSPLLLYIHRSIWLAVVANHIPGYRMLRIDPIKVVSVRIAVNNNKEYNSQSVTGRPWDKLILANITYPCLLWGICGWGITNQQWQMRVSTADSAIFVISMFLIVLTSPIFYSQDSKRGLSSSSWIDRARSHS